MELPDLLQVLRRKWFFVVLAVAGCVLAATAATALSPKSYTAKTSFLLTANAKNASDASPGGLYIAGRVASYAQAAAGDQFAATVVDQLGLAESPSELASTITASAPSETTIVDVGVTADTPAQAHAVAAAIDQRFGPFLQQVEPSDRLVLVEVLQPATTPIKPDSPKPAFNLLIGLLAGLVLGLLGAIVLYRRDGDLSTSADLPERLGVRTLGDVRTLVTNPWQSGRVEPGWRATAGALGVLTQERGIRTIGVRGSSDIDTRAALAESLATAAAAAGSQVLLVLARPSWMFPGTGADGGAAAQGAAWQWSPRLLQVSATLSVLPLPAGVQGLSSAELKYLMDTRPAADLVVVALPDLAAQDTGAIAEPACEALVLMVDSRRATAAQIRADLLPLRPEDRYVLGGVLVTPSRRDRDERTPEQAPVGTAPLVDVHLGGSPAPTATG